MRYPPKHKAEIHSRIVEEASRRLRSGGLEGAAIVPLMRENGLTYGGFYKHFQSKDDLLVESLERAFEEIGANMTKLGEQAAPGTAWKEIIQAYLSAEHCRHPEAGCPIGAIGPELARLSADVKKRIHPAMAKYRDRLLRFMPGRRTEDRERAFSVIFPAMVGAIQMARTLPEKDAQRLLTTSRDFLLDSFSD